MGVLKNLFNKATKNEEIKIEIPTDEPTDLSPTISETTFPQPDNQNLVIMSPINYSLEKIANKIELPSDCLHLLETLQSISKKPNVSIKDIDALCIETKKEIDVLTSNLENLKEKYKTYLNIHEAIDYIEALISQTQNIQNKPFKADELNYEKYMESQIITQFQDLKKLLLALQENFSEIELTGDLQKKIVTFIESTPAITKSFQALTIEIENLKTKATTLTDEIMQFTAALNKVKAMGNVAGVDEYYKQLSDSKEILTEKRELFLQEETRLNEYIAIVNQSIEQTLDAFNSLIKPISSELEGNISTIKTLHGDIFLSPITPAMIEQQKNDIEKINVLESELNKCKSLHEKFN